MDKLQLRFANEVEVGDFTIKIPKVKDIVRIGEDKYNQLLKPYFITKDVVGLNSGVFNQINNFDLFFISGEDGKNKLLQDDGVPYLDVLLESLKFYFSEELCELNGLHLKDEYGVDFGYDDDVLSQINYILVENNGLIDRTNFDDIADMILKINFTERKEIKPEPKFKSKRKKDIYNKIMEGRRRKQEKDAHTIADMVRIVQFGGKSFINFDTIQEFTIYQLIDTYMSILSIDSFNIKFWQYHAGADPKELNLEHWTEEIKKLNR